MLDYIHDILDMLKFDNFKITKWYFHLHCAILKTLSLCHSYVELNDIIITTLCSFSLLGMNNFINTTIFSI